MEMRKSKELSFYENIYITKLLNKWNNKEFEVKYLKEVAKKLEEVEGRLIFSRGEILM